MKKYLVIGNPIDHSLSPKLHNKWFKTTGIEAIYEKKKIVEEDLEEIINKIMKPVKPTNAFSKRVSKFLNSLE